MSEEGKVEDVKPEIKESAKIQQEFQRICSMVGDTIHKLELLKKDQMKLQDAYNAAVEKEKPAPTQAS